MSCSRREFQGMYYCGGAMEGDVTASGYNQMKAVSERHKSLTEKSKGVDCKWKWSMVGKIAREKYPNYTKFW